MGEEVEADRDPLNGDITIGMPGLEDEAQRLADAYGLENSHALQRLLDMLFGYSCRDQTVGITPEQLSERRAKAYKHAQLLRNEAASMLMSLGKINEAMIGFNEVAAFNSAILEAVFDVCTGEPDNLFLPPSLSVLADFFPGWVLGDDVKIIKSYEEMALEGNLADDIQQALKWRFLWEEVDDRLTKLAALPVRDKLARGRMPNVVLRQAVALIEHFWRHHTPHSWSMSALKNKETREESDVETLQGDCERFVAEVLTVSGLRFNLPDLYNAWSAVDMQS